MATVVVKEWWVTPVNIDDIGFMQRHGFPYHFNEPQFKTVSTVTGSVQMCTQGASINFYTDNEEMELVTRLYYAGRMWCFDETVELV